jgi:hypothetical protein
MTTPSRLSPTLHEDFLINTRVSFDVGDGVRRFGVISGIGFQHIIFAYLITLDVPIHVPGWNTPWTVISLPGGLLTKV